MKCPNCDKDLLTVDYLKHSLEHKDMLICPLRCGDVFTSRDYYLRQRGQPCWQRGTKRKSENGPAAPQAADTEPDNPHVPTNNDDCILPLLEDSGDDEENGAYEDIIELFVMLNNSGLSQKSQNEAAVRLQGLFDSVRAATKASVTRALTKIKEKLMKAAGIELSTFLDEAEIYEEIMESAAIDVPDAVKTQYRREKAMTGTGGRVHGNVVQVPATFQRPGKSTRKEFALQYHRPLKKVLLEMAKHEEHLTRWRAPFSLQNTPRWQQHGKERVHHSPLHSDQAERIAAEVGTRSNLILIEIYSDDVKHTGGNRNVNDSTVGHSYFGILNMAGPDSRRQGYWQSHHFCLPKDYENKDEMKQYGLVIRDLNDLIQNDLVLPSGERFKVRLVTLSGDQKELHLRLGLVAHFMAEYTDRYTYATMRDRINSKSSSELLAAYASKRTVETTQEDIAKCEREKKPVRGHIRRPLLDSLPYYSVFGPGGTSACVSHDLHTGINKHDLSLSFRCIILEGWSTLAELNSLITSFKTRLAGDDATSYPGNIAMCLSGNTISIQGNMAQSKNLVRFLPLILKPVLDRHPELENHPAWKVILGLAELNAGWASFAISQSQLEYLNDAYLSYIDTRFTLVSILLNLTKTTLEDKRKRQVYTDLKPKHGTLLSYPALTKELGALAYFSTLPAEQKNGRIKKHLQDGNCFKNIIKSTGKYANTKETFTPKYVAEIDSVIPLKGAARTALKASANPLIEKTCGMVDYTLCEKVELHGVTHQRHQAVAYYKTDACNAFTIGTIEALILINEDSGMKLALITNKQHHEEIQHFNCYRLRSSGELEFVFLKDLASHAPCNQLQIDDLGTVIVFPSTPTILGKPPFVTNSNIADTRQPRNKNTETTASSN